MKSYRDNGLEQISETQLKTTHGHFIASGKNKCKEKNHQLRSCHCFSVGKLWQLTGSRFHTLFNLASLSSNKLLYRKSWYKTSNSRPCPLSTYIHHSHTHIHRGLIVVLPHLQEPRHLPRLPPNSNIIKADNQEKHTQVHVLQSKLKVWCETLQR